jgi:hypothetical protein
MEERRKTVAGAQRKNFALLARAAVEKHVPEARTGAAHWGSKSNLGWVRWPLEDGCLIYLGLRRHLDWVTGEVGVSAEPCELEDLELRAVPGDSCDPGYRVRLGHLLHDEDKWWPSGKSEKELVERLEWLVLQMKVKARTFFSAL